MRKPRKQAKTDPVGAVGAAPRTLAEAMKQRSAHRGPRSMTPERRQSILSYIRTTDDTYAAIGVRFGVTGSAIYQLAMRARADDDRIKHAFGGGAREKRDFKTDPLTDEEKAGQVRLAGEDRKDQEYWEGRRQASLKPR